MTMIGFHYVDLVYSDGQRLEHLKHIAAIKPRYVNILGGAQYDQARKFAAEIQKEVPETKIIFRHFKDGGDDGMWTRIEAVDWVNRIASQYAGTGWIIVPDNEANAPDLTAYSQWMADAITAASKIGVPLAVARFPTHNPRVSQIENGELDVMWQALATHRDVGHIWSPNAYYTANNHDGMSHIQHGIKRMHKVTGQVPKVVIGEFAMAVNLDPHNGFKSINMGHREYAKQIIELHRKFFQPSDIDVCIYSVGPWPLHNDTFGVDNDFLRVLAENPVAPPERAAVPETTAASPIFSASAAAAEPVSGAASFLASSAVAQPSSTESPATSPTDSGFITRAEHKRLLLEAMDQLRREFRDQLAQVLAQVDDGAVGD